MIRKNTKIVLQNHISKETHELTGGVDLVKGEDIRIHRKGVYSTYIVTGKVTDCHIDEDPPSVTTTYVMRKGTGSHARG